MRTITVAAALVLLAGAADAAPRQVETIRYETTACFGFCPAYVVTVSADGRATFEPRRHTAAMALRRFRVTPAQFAAFRARLASVRPLGETLIEPENKALCGLASTDQISVDMRWGGGRGDPRHLSFYFGCDRERYADLRRALTDAPGALPIAAFIGTPGRNATR